MRCFSDLVLSAARTATGRMGWSADAFWSATAAELLLALGGAAGGDADIIAPLARGELCRLREKLGDG